MKPCPYCGNREPEIDSFARAGSDIKASCPSCGNNFIIPVGSKLDEPPIEVISDDNRIAITELYAEAVYAIFYDSKVGFVYALMDTGSGFPSLKAISKFDGSDSWQV